MESYFIYTAALQGRVQGFPGLAASNFSSKVLLYPYTITDSNITIYYFIAATIISLFWAFAFRPGQILFAMEIASGGTNRQDKTLKW